MTEKNGKPYIKCQVRGKEVQAKPEEIIRQLWIHRLKTHYQYPVPRLQVEYPIGLSPWLGLFLLKAARCSA